MKSIIKIVLIIAILFTGFVFAKTNDNQKLENAVSTINKMIQQKGSIYGNKVIDGLKKLKLYFVSTGQTQKVSIVDYLLTNIKIEMQQIDSKTSKTEDLSKILTRQDVGDEFKWNFNDIYISDEAWQSDFKKVEESYMDFGNYKGKLSDPKVLLEFLEKGKQLDMSIEKLYYYASLMMSINETDSNSIIKTERVMTLNSKVNEVKSFVAPELLSYSQEVLQGLINYEGLKDYKMMLEDLLRQKAHVLSEKEESLLAKMSQIAGSNSTSYDKLTNAELEYPKFQDDNGNLLDTNRPNLLAVLESGKRETRKNFFNGYYETFGKFRNTLAAMLYGNLKELDTFAKSSNYKSVFDQSFESINLSPKVFTNLIETTNKNLPVLHKSISLRKKVLGLDTVHLYDLNVSLVSDLNQKYSYETAKGIIENSLKLLGNEYNEYLQESYKNRWIDVYQAPNKSNGAFQASVYGIHPYVLLNFNNTFDSVTTMAHELGHAMYSYFAEKNQPYTYASPSIFTHEVASITNELLLSDHLIQNAKTDDEKLYYLNRLVNTIESTFFTQVMYSEFEKIINDMVNQDQPLTADVLDEVWKKIVIKYRGNEFTYDESYNSKWSSVPHFFTPFYVYKYATSIAAANLIVEKVKSNDPKITDQYISFLKAGGSNYPNELLKIAGIDMTQPVAVDSLMKYYSGLIDQMELIFKKKGVIK